MPAKQETKKNCFVIAPIGTEGSPERVRSDQVFRHVIEPVVRARGYEPERADHMGKPGLITSQIIDRLLDDHMVVADLTGNNPNVYYELAIRHAIRKPVVLIVHQGEKLPFDVAPARTIHFDYRDLDSVDHCKTELGRQIDAAEKNPADVDSPVSVAIDVKALRSSGDLTSQTLTQILAQLQDLQARVQALTAPKKALMEFPPSTDWPQYYLAGRSPMTHDDLVDRVLRILRGQESAGGGQPPAERDSENKKRSKEREPSG